MDNQSMMTAAEVAQRLRISRSLAYRLLTEGRIRAFRTGRVVRVSAVDLERFIRENSSFEGQPPSEPDGDRFEPGYAIDPSDREGMRTSRRMP
jgi:putative molybdopterin biosynthesis protein